MSVSPMMTHYLQIKQSYPDCIIFYRLGDFYEMFYDDAVLASKELDLTLTGKNCGLEERAPMCGIPFHAYENYARKLVEKGYKVAICEQLTDPRPGKIVERDVIKILTSGTLTESSMLDDSKNNYIMCVMNNNNTISYAYADISTGEFKAGEINENIIQGLNDQIVRISPAEIICNESMYDLKDNLPCMIANDRYKLSKYLEWAFQFSSAKKLIERHFNLNNLNGFDFALSDNIICVVGALLQFIYDTQKRSISNLSIPVLEKSNEFMYIDSNTRRNLELEENCRDRDKKNSLLWVLDDTKTSMGKRMLKNWLRQPLQSIKKIQNRQDKVSALFDSPLIRQLIDSKLNSISDIERIAGRIAFGTVNPRELLSLAMSLEQIPEIRTSILNFSCFNDVAENMFDFSNLISEIYKTIDENASVNIKDGSIIKNGINVELDKLRDMSKNSKKYLNEIEARERENTKIKNLKIGYNRVFGYYIEVNKQYSELVPFSYIRKQTISNNERYVTEELKKLEDELIASEEKSIKLEIDIYNDFKNRLLAYIEQLKIVSSSIATIDCINSFAKIAIKNDYNRPIVDDSGEIEIINGRHPVVEMNLKKNEFVTNNCYLNKTTDQIMIITGPNMAGKSTFMRQVALITFMAHLGSFVPATKAKISLVDRIFTRIGASDDLSIGQSTFMVEMVEVANILNSATDKSLILLDEVGRGTSTYDGLSIAWAVVEYIAKKFDTKTLFATHYHELTELEGKLEGVKNYRVTISEIGGEIVFLRKIERGGALRSFGIEVAGLAGLPKDIIAKAKTILSNLEIAEVNIQNKTQNNDTNSSSKIEKIIKGLDINNITPIKAMETLSYLIDQVNLENNNEN